MQEIVEGLQIEAVRHRIDDGLDSGGGHLHQAELRPIGLVAHEFGIERDVGRRPKLGRERLQPLGGIDNGKCRRHFAPVPLAPGAVRQMDPSIAG